MTSHKTVVEETREYADLPRAFHNNSFCKIWGSNRVDYGQLENRELFGFVEAAKFRDSDEFSDCVQNV